MHFLFSNRLLHAALLLHLQLCTFILKYEVPWAYYGSSTSDSDHGLVAADGVICQCTSVPGQATDRLNFKSQYLIDLYVQNGRVHNVSPELNLDGDGFTCILLDEEKLNLWLVGDPIGNNPLWYSFNQSSANNKELPTFLVTTDYIMASKLGFIDLYVLQPNYMLAANLATNQVHHYLINLDRQHSHYMIQNIQYDLLDMYSHQLLASLMTTIDTTQTTGAKSNIFMEVDNSVPSTAFIDCAYESLGISRNHITQQPPTEIQESSQHLFNRITTNSSLTSVHRETLFERFVLVDSLNQLSFNEFYVSNIIGVGADSRAYLRTYAQHFFVEMLGVNATVSNPYLNLQFQVRFWNFYGSELDGLLLLLLDNLRAQGICSPEKAIENEASASYSAFHQSKGPNHIGKLWQLGHRYASSTHKVFLVVVTSGYQDLFVNFICSLRANNVASLKNIIVITFTDDIVSIAQAYGLGHYVPSNVTESTIANFGTLSYQSLILTRTKLVMNLMHLGFSCIIIDIDTVWLNDPMLLLDAMHRQYDYDVAFTDDGGEVCGCFLDLSSSDYAVLFWETVTKQHESLLISMKSNPKFDFTESEQKILTRLIHGKGYDAIIVDRDTSMFISRKNMFITLQLQADLFPSGLNYFNLFSAIGLRGKVTNNTTPYIVHNNFVVGKDIKISRFKKYKLWYSDTQYQCRTGPDLWSILPSFTPLYDAKIPSISLLQPPHNSKDKNASSVLAVAHVNGLSEDIVCIKTWFDLDPPSYLLSSYLGIYSFDHKTAHDTSNVDSKSVTVTMCNTSFWRINPREVIGISSDFTFHNDIFGVDYGGRSVYMYMAQERLLKLKKGMVLGESTRKSEINVAGSAVDATNRLQMEYSIIILAHKRPSSLARLLQSLLAADFSAPRRHDPITNWHVPLKIYIDANKSAADYSLVDQVFAIATNFSWPHGEKLVIRRERNIGLIDSWFHSWNPQRENEAAFIFEDDIVVSPHFFQFGTSAVTKYYADDPYQRQRQRRLLEVFKSSLSQTKFNRSLFDTVEFDRFMRDTAGLPLIYGICLQRQHLDPFHSPLERVRVNNGNKPFLYSLIGSWGPLMLPTMWQAFREWWRYTAPREHQFYTHIVPGRSIIRDYYNKNKGIWTPWMVRFAYETGAKCLYSNLPYNLSLIVNYREGNGENYVSTMGPDSELLDNNTVTMHDMKAALKLPPIETLSLWQFDLNMRRLGSFGVRKPFIMQVDTATEFTPESLAIVNNVRKSIEWAANVQYSDIATTLTTEHAFLILEAIEEQLLRVSSMLSIKIMHIGFNPFVPLLDELIGTYNSADNDFSQIVTTFDNAPCKLLPSGLLHTACASYISTESVQILMFDLHHVSTYDIFTELSQSVHTILILSSSCIGSPTDFVLHSSNSTFTLTGDICSEGYIDVGLSIYHRVSPDKLDNWRSSRLSVSQRVKEYDLDGVSKAYVHRIVM